MKVKVNSEFLKYYNLFKVPTNPHRGYSATFQAALRGFHKKLALDYIERDYFDEEVIGRLLDLEFDVNLHKTALQCIAMVCEYMECYPVCQQYLKPGELEPRNSVTIVGYRNDVLIAERILICLINGYGHARANMQSSYRKARERQRKRRSKSPNYINARTRAYDNYTKHLELTRELLLELLRNKEYGLVHNPKKNHLKKQIEGWFNLDYAYPNAKEKKIWHAMVRNKWIENRILIR